MTKRGLIASTISRTTSRLKILRARPGRVPSKFRGASAAPGAIFLLLFVQCVCGQSSAPGADLLARRVKGYEDTASSSYLLLRQLSLRYGFALGLEEVGDPLPNPVTVKLGEGTITDIINAIVNQMPGYAWREVKGVVNVSPRTRASSVLDVWVQRFHVRNATPFTLPGQIAAQPEIKEWLTRNGVAEHTAFVGIGPPKSIEKSMPRISLDLRDSTLCEILNEFLRTGQASRWVVARYGDHEQYLSIVVE